MRSKIPSLLSLPVLFALLGNPASLIANAKGAPPPERSSASCKEEWDQRAQIGGSYTYSWITPDGSSTTSGSLGGVQAIYEYRPLDFIYAGTAFHYRIGSTSNDATTRTLQDFNPQARIGYTFSQPHSPGSENRCTLFTGFGGRYMAEKVTVGAASLDFDYTTFYVPVGFLLEKKFSSHFSLGCNFQWMPQVLPMVRIDLLDGAQWDITKQFLNFFVEIPLIVSLCGGQYAMSICPYFESWRDGSSTAETLTNLSLNLPGNKYLFTGVNVNFLFSF